MVDVGGRIADVESLAVDFRGGLFEESDHLVGDVAYVAVAADNGLAARMDVEAFLRDAPEFLRVARMPRSPDIGWPHHDPLAMQVGVAGFLLGDHLALSVNRGGKVVLVVDGEPSGSANKLRRAHEHAPDRRGGLDGREEIARALGVGAEAGLGGRFFVHLGPGSEVHDLVRDKFGHGLPQQVGIQNIDLAPEGAMGGLVRDLERQVQHSVSPDEEAIDDLGSNEARATGDEDFSH